MTPGKLIQMERKSANLTQRELAARLGVSGSLIGQYENGFRNPSAKTLQNIADALNIDVTALNGGLYTCPICGFSYTTSLDSDIETHTSYHQKFCKAKAFFGDFLYPFSNLGKVKSDAYDILNSDIAALKEKNNAALELFKAWFSRSVSAHGYSLRHPMFDDYAAMLLNQTRFQDILGREVYAALVKKYGKSPGLPDGQTTYLIDDIRKYGITLADIDTHQETEIQFISQADMDALVNAPNDSFHFPFPFLVSWSKLNASGREKAIERVEELAEIPKYQRKEPSQNTPTPPDNPKE